MSNEKAQHTPGPWETGYIQYNDDGKFIEIVNKGRIVLIATVVANDDDKIDDEAVANANLIAAAPDLLAALIGLTESLSEDYDNPPADSPLGIALAAIAKARGEV